MSVDHFPADDEVTPAPSERGCPVLSARSKDFIYIFTKSSCPAQTTPDPPAQGAPPVGHLTSWCRLFPFIFLLLIPAVCLTLYDYVRKTGGPPPARTVYTVLMMLISTRTGDRFPVGHVPQNIGIILICVYWHHHLPSLPDLLIHRPRDPFAFPAIGHQCSAVQCRALTDWLSPPCFISASDLMKLIQQIWIVM